MKALSRRPDKQFHTIPRFISTRLRQNQSVTRRLRILLFILISALTLLPDARAQKTCGELIGQVYDPTGKSLAGVKVTMTNVLNGNSRAKTTDKGGYYRHPCLPPGNYKIIASKQGYLDASINFSVQLNQKNVIEYPPDITLNLIIQNDGVTDNPGTGSLPRRVKLISAGNRLGPFAPKTDGVPVMSDGSYLMDIPPAPAPAETHESRGTQAILIQAGN